MYHALTDQALELPTTNRHLRLAPTEVGRLHRTAATGIVAPRPRRLDILVIGVDHRVLVLGLVRRIILGHVHLRIVVLDHRKGHVIEVLGSTEIVIGIVTNVGVGVIGKNKTLGKFTVPTSRCIKMINHQEDPRGRVDEAREDPHAEMYLRGRDHDDHRDSILHRTGIFLILFYRLGRCCFSYSFPCVYPVLLVSRGFGSTTKVNANVPCSFVIIFECPQHTESTQACK